MAKEKSIQVRCITKDHVDISEMTEFQGELKTLMKEQYEQLKHEILETGFAFPIYLWQSEEGPKYIIGGHQRVFVLKRLREEGYTVPPIPVVYVHANGLKEAKRRVLQDVAQYGKIGFQGLYEFMHESDIKIEDIMKDFTFPELNLNEFARGYFGDIDPNQVTDPNSEWKGMPEFKQEDKESFRHIIVHFAKEEHVDAFFKKVGMSYTDETKSIWFPEQKRMDTKTRVYADQDNATA